MVIYPDIAKYIKKGNNWQIIPLLPEDMHQKIAKDNKDLFEEFMYPLIALYRKYMVLWKIVREVPQEYAREWAKKFNGYLEVYLLYSEPEKGDMEMHELIVEKILDGSLDDNIFYAFSTLAKISPDIPKEFIENKEYWKYIVAEYYEYTKVPFEMIEYQVKNRASFIMDNRDIFKSLTDDEQIALCTVHIDNVLSPSSFLPDFITTYNFPWRSIPINAVNDLLEYSK